MAKRKRYEELVQKEQETQGGENALETKEEVKEAETNVGEVILVTPKYIVIKDKKGNNMTLGNERLKADIKYAKGDKINY